MSEKEILLFLQGYNLYFDEKKQEIYSYQKTK